jgi:hypothetical protein
MLTLYFNSKLVVILGECPMITPLLGDISHEADYSEHKKLLYNSQ